MDKKSWLTEARICEAHGLHILAQCARDIAEEKVVTLTREERARKYLAQVERRVVQNFAPKSAKQLIITAIPRKQS